MTGTAAAGVQSLNQKLAFGGFCYSVSVRWQKNKNYNLATNMKYIFFSAHTNVKDIDAMNALDRFT